MIAYLLFAFLGIFALGAATRGSTSSTPDIAADPKPTPIEPDPEPIDPTPAPVDPGPEPVDPTPTPVDPDPIDPVPRPEEPGPTPIDPEPTPDPVNPDPVAPVQQVDTSSGGSVAPTALGNGIDVAGGRVTTLSLENADNIDSVRIIDGPEIGNLTVNPDNTLALVMSGEPGFSGAVNFSYEVTYQDGSTQVLENYVDVLASTQDSGWGAGNFYMLEADEAGDVIVETGDNHREVYISGSNDALSLSEIAALEGLSTDQIDTHWLQAHPEYGGSSGMALDSTAGMELWRGISGEGSEPSSNWLLFERGYEYSDLGDEYNSGILSLSGTLGEDPLHPVHITSYGEGAKPVLDTNISIFGITTENIVFSQIEVMQGVSVVWTGENIIFDNVDITNNGTEAGKMGLLIDDAAKITLNNSAITDVYYTADQAFGDTWSAGTMTSGLLIGRTEGVLIQGSLFDHNGWAPDYYENMSTEGGQAPTVFSHNVYIDYNALDVTFRDNISMQAANNGVMIRSGGFIEDNAMIDNNAAGNVTGGEFEGTGQIGNFTLFTSNLITSAGYRESEATGIISGGFDNRGVDTTLIDNIIAHLADPNNSEEYADKRTAFYPQTNGDDPFYNDTIIYNWISSGQLEDWGYDQNLDDQNTDNLDTSVLDATTIQIFTQQLLGDPNATIADLADFLRAQADGSLDDYVDADLIIDFFQVGFGLSVEDRITSETLRFVPDDLGDGIRWDNRMNWTTDDLPGTIAGDSVDLGGNWVNYGGTTTIENLNFGSGGELTVGHGKLTVEGNTEAGDNGAVLNIFNAGQVWMNGYSDADPLEIEVAGGRFVNTGHMDGNTTLNIFAGQNVLASDGATYDVGASSSISINGSDASVGFDGELGDTGVLRLEEGGTLSFSADSEGFATIEEFRTGAMGDNPDIASGVNLGLGSLELDITALNGAAGTYDLIAVDEIIGELSDINLIGLGANQDAHLVIDYTTDTLTVQLTAPGEGGGSITLAAEGEETDMDSADAAALWEALTAGHDTLSDDLATRLYLDDEYADEMVA